MAMQTEHRPSSRHARSRSDVLAILFSLLMGGVAPGAVRAQTTPEAPLTRDQVKMERVEFLKTHRWDSRLETYVMRESASPPQGVKSRAEIKAQRDEFLATHRWEDSTGWVPKTPAKPAGATLPREQVRNETAQFMQTHRWSEESDSWVERSPRKKQ
jgi:hypothetical protein